MNNIDTYYLNMADVYCCDTDYIDAIQEAPGSLDRFLALIRFKGHQTPFDDQPMELVEEHYFCLTQTQFVSMFNLTKGDDTIAITLKITKVHNDFFRNLSDADGNIFRQAKSQRQLTTLSEGAIKFTPYIAMIRIQSVAV